MEKNKKKAFIHISDLHIVTNMLSGSTKNKRYDKFWLQVDGANTDSYIEHFCFCVKNEFKNHKFYLIVSGDIADRACQTEYDCALKLFKTIKNELDISNDRILIVPGNHDINRKLCERAADEPENSTKKAWELHEEKFKTFASFYHNIKSVNFDAEKAIFDKMLIPDEKLLFLGINSNYQLGFDDGWGAVNIRDLKSQLESIKQEYSKYSIISVFHHNLNSQHIDDNSHYGAFHREGYNDFIDYLSEYKISCAFFGNEHITSHTQVKDIQFSNSGIFARRSGKSTFKLYELNDNNDELYFEEHLYECKDEEDKDNRVFGTWIKQGRSQKILLRDCKNQSLTEINSNPTQNPIEKPQQHNGNKKQNSTGEHTKAKEIEESPSQDYITNLIKGKNIFHQGHFHWGDNSRSLNWIDITSLFKDRETKKEIQKKLIEFIKSKKIDYDAVIGIGMGGNILATPLLVEGEKQYTYLPYSYRYDKSHEVEQNPNFDSNVCNILMITDVVHSGNSILELIKEKSKDSFQSINEIHVISLLYTGRIGEDVFNSDKRIKFHPMASVEIAQCPYDDENKCPNFQNKFCDIFELDPKDDTTKSDLGNASKN